MKHFSPAKSYLTIIFWNIFGIAIVICIESWLAYSPNKPLKAKIQIPFYSICVLYYCFVSYVFLPYIYRRYRNLTVMLVSLLVLLLIFTILYATVNTLVLSALVKRWIFLIRPEDIQASAGRGIEILVISCSVWVVRQYRANKKAAKELQRQKREVDERFAALQNLFLRSQMRSHMLYNSLTTIYAKVLEKAPDAPGAIMLLIKLLDYDLKYGNEGMTVSLEEDLNIIDTYIQLNQLLEEDQLQYNFYRLIDDGTTQVAPLLMLTFVDNIFKHGDPFDADAPVIIRVTLEKGELRFYARNKIRTQNVAPKRGVGFTNTRQRLDILYPERYRLEAHQNETDFEVDLIIFL